MFPLNFTALRLRSTDCHETLTGKNLLSGWLPPRQRTGLLRRPEENLWPDEVFPEGPLRWRASIDGPIQPSGAAAFRLCAMKCYEISISGNFLFVVEFLETEADSLRVPEKK